MTSTVFIATVIAIFVVAVFCDVYIKSLPSKRHRKNIKKAKQVIDKLRRRGLTKTEEIPVVLGTLRSVDPFVLEELVLTCYQEKGWRIIRNKRYTGDGGIDGRVLINNQLFLIQVKRYSNHINAQHIKDFQQAIYREGAAGGFFVHTGKTGKLSRSLVKNSRVSIVSGKKLVDFVLHNVHS